jgi:hypothetical protein
MRRVLWLGSDGFFGDKWNSAAQPDPNSTTGGWKICNHECGSVTEAQGKAWNAGKARVLATTTSICGDGAKKHAPFDQFCTKNDHFTQTGSGQT